MKTKVKFANESIILVKGRGSILIQQKDSNHAYIFDVLYILAMKNNLISLGFPKKGYKMKIERGNLSIIDNKSIMILKALWSKNRTFRVEIQFGNY